MNRVMIRLLGLSTANVARVGAVDATAASASVHASPAAISVAN